MRKLIEERDQARNQLQDGVTVCITYHDEPLSQISEAITSATTQTVSPLEVIVIDDGSNRPIEVHELIPDVRMVRITNRGLPAARNTGLMLARGSAFLPLDADDSIEPTYIEKTLPLLADADVVLVGLQEHGPTRNGTYMPGYDRPYDQVTEETLWSYNRFFYCSLFKTQVLREIGGYHPAMAGWPGVSGGYEDWTTWIDLKRRGAVFAAVNEPLLHYNTSNPQGMLMKAERNRQVLVDEMRRHHRKSD